MQSVKYKTMKNSIAKHVLIGIVLLWNFSLHAQTHGIKASTPYGEIEFSDDDNSSRRLNEFAKASGDYRTDSLNTRAIISVCEVADGALSEMMDYICLDDFVNKPEIAVDIYTSDDYALEKYIDFVAIGLCINDCEDTNRAMTAVDELALLIEPKVKDESKKETLSNIIAKIKLIYERYKNEY